jgi:formylglycine-generating enzyme required for sulfatase activity
LRAKRYAAVKAGGGRRGRAAAVCGLLLALAGCTDSPQDAAPQSTATSAAASAPPLPAPPPLPVGGRITVTGDDALIATLTWQAPAVSVSAANAPAVRRLAASALADGRLFENADTAIPQYLALLALDPLDRDANTGLRAAFARLLEEGETALALAEDDGAAMQRALRIAAVVRSVGANRYPTETLAFLPKVDAAERLWELNTTGERALAAATPDPEAALVAFRQALALAPGQARASQGVAAVESALLRRAEEAALRGDFIAAERELREAARIRPGFDTIAAGRERVEAVRRSRIAQLQVEGLRLLAEPNRPNALRNARAVLAEMLRIAAPAEPAAAELRQRIDRATHYGLMQPGQRFTDGLDGGGRGPAMVVVPHGGFRMGAGPLETEADDAERPTRYVRFDRGFAMARTEITIAQFRVFIEASGYKPRALRRGHSMVYDERGGNFIRRSGVDWRHDYMGRPAADTLPVVHVSPKDAEAYARWLSERTGQRYRLPSEAEFEYAVRAGRTGRYAWGEGTPPPGSGNFTGSGDVSPAGRRWGNAFRGYGDGHWGPAPVASYRANAFGLYDLDGNVSEWVADCWHEGYRRAPTKGEAWLNPGCRVRVLRGGAWSSAPAHTRSAWRSYVENDVTNARTGFRVVREL